MIMQMVSRVQNKVIQSNGNNALGLTLYYDNSTLLRNTPCFAMRKNIRKPGTFQAWYYF